MGLSACTQIDSWLQSGGLVLTVSDRAARTLILAFHERRQAEGLSAWPAPCIQTFAAFARSAWETRATDDRLLLNPQQEQSLWTSILAREDGLLTLLEGPRQRLAALAADAHSLICSYTARYLQPAARASWDNDAAAFSRWLAEFDGECERLRALSSARLPLELIDLLQADAAIRPPLLLVGFDRLLPIQRAVFDAWGNWQELSPPAPASAVHFYSAADEAAEFAACAAWCASELAERPSARILVLAQSLSTRRGALERAFLRSLPAPSFELSLGLPLKQVPLARAATLLLRWLTSSLLESEIDWLLSTGFAAMQKETLQLQSYMYALRRAGRMRPQWPLEVFLDQPGAVQPPREWVRRLIEAHRRVDAALSLSQPTLEWSVFAFELLASLGLPGEGISSTEHQTWQRLQTALETTGSLAFDGRHISWSDFLQQLDNVLADSLFAAESHNAPIQIAGPAEAAGLTADAIWFLSASEEQWPAPGSTHPLLPLYVQRESGMPHATAQLDWQLAQATTTRILASAPAVTFSYALHTTEANARPSRLIPITPQPIPAGLAPHASVAPQIIEVRDVARIPFPHATVSGGASTLTAQSQCPFQAFATARLGARAWAPAEFGLSAAQRGQLLHAVLHAIWAGPPHGIRSLTDLRALPNLGAFVLAHVQRAMQTGLPDGSRDRMPSRYLELEAERLIALIIEWLNYESARADFTVEQTEAESSAAVASLVLNLRLDRIDRLSDGTLAVIDYKTGKVSASAWDLPRPDDVQLPLYATFALYGENPGGLLIAQLRAGESGFSGRMRDAQTTLFPALTRSASLVNKPLTDEQLDSWRSHIEQLAHDFLSGRSVVDPRDWPKTCDRCGLHSLCRIRENRAAIESDNEEEADE
ncbi:MAG TPA: PD-(D/E)XK nuclease family protein [Terracidiphilus sp.]|nr:PD-(D/E)XK nuclease family protein [Terracidiphilus sp.]